MIYIGFVVANKRMKKVHFFDYTRCIKKNEMGHRNSTGKLTDFAEYTWVEVGWRHF